MLKALENKVISGKSINKIEALALYEADLDELCWRANRLREYFCGAKFDLCSIINAKSGKCSENCTFCAQSKFAVSECACYPLLTSAEILAEARKKAEQNIKCFSMVTSGRSPTDAEIAEICATVRRASEDRIDLQFCVSLGLLNEFHYQKLKAAGVRRIHNNLETSVTYFPNVCTSHTYNDKVTAILLAQKHGFGVCSGGIFGLGESPGDRLDLAFALKELNIKSVPLNILTPIKGTPYEGQGILTNAEVLRIIATFRFILPDATLRLAGGRALLPAQGALCFKSGANAAITSDLLTTGGVSLEEDRKMVVDLGFVL